TVAAGEHAKRYEQWDRHDQSSSSTPGYVQAVLLDDFGVWAAKQKLYRIARYSVDGPCTHCRRFRVPAALHFKAQGVEAAFDSGPLPPAARIARSMIMRRCSSGYAPAIFSPLMNSVGVDSTPR